MTTKGWAISAGISLTLLLPALGCQSAAQEQEQAVQAAAIAAAREKAQEKASLLANPAGYLETSGLQSYDEGIINSYRQLTGVTVLNKSHFAVRNLQGDATWLDAQGRRFGSTPFTLNGSVAAGDTKRFSTGDGTMTSGTLQANAPKVLLTFTHVDAID